MRQIPSPKTAGKALAHIFAIIFLRGRIRCNKFVPAKLRQRICRAKFLPPKRRKRILRTFLPLFFRLEEFCGQNSFPQNVGEKFFAPNIREFCAFCPQRGQKCEQCEQTKLVSRAKPCDQNAARAKQKKSLKFREFCATKIDSKANAREEKPEWA